MHVRKAFEEVLRGALGFVELAGTDEVSGGVRGGGKLVDVILDADQHAGPGLAKA